mmetsp:Transcript_17202/g.36280  ORF Transcript_17202/g.36280 Transcript_17202/m.36280 type:complete len:230 (+) Transcript_17202:348-1037(+)
MAINPSPSSFYTRISAAESDMLKSDADMIRCRLLNKLGIYDSNFTNASIHHKIRSERSKRKSQRRQQKQPRLSRMPSSLEEPRDSKSLVRTESARYFVPLKLKDDSCISPNFPNLSNLSLESPSHNLGDCSPGPASRSNSRRVSLSVKFDSSVTVVPIPSHRSYSPRIHTHLFISQEEMAAHAARNTKEYIYEGWDWRHVIEEQGMYISKVTGEFVHPAHVISSKNPYL